MANNFEFAPKEIAEAFIGLGRLGGELYEAGHQEYAQRLYMLSQVIATTMSNVRRVNEEQILNAFERGKGFGIAEGMKMMRLKELTDEEIGEIYWKLYCDDWTEEDIKFARAILRKAQEK